MLRVVAQKSAAAARQYYTEGLRREDYYSQEQEVVGKWHGKGAQLLALSGDVLPEAFAALVENRHPGTGKQLTPRMKADRRVGYDLNFHAPKSLSVLHALGGDERIVSAFRGAVAETMAEIEEFASTRVRRGGAKGERTTGNLVWAEFVHFTARPVGGIPDPHLHVHGYCMNSTWDETEGRWKAVSWVEIKENAPYFEAVFHARLAGKVRELGYGIERSRTGWEVAGIPRSLVDKFSRRTAQIERLAHAKGITDAKSLDALGAASREGKRKGLTKAELQAAWEVRLTPEERQAIVAAKGKGISNDSVTPAKAFDDACEKVFAKASVADPKRLVAAALRFGIGSLTPDRVWQEFNRRNMVVKEVDGEVLCTSIDVLAEEVALINSVRSGKGMCASIVSGDARFGDEKLSPEQRNAVRHILQSNDQVIGVRGVAGTGKTRLMREVATQIEATGIRLFAFAPSASASRDKLREDGFVNAETVAHLLLNKKLQEDLRGQVIWIDEAGTIGARDMLAIMQIAGSSTRVILTGDTAQHAPVPRGDALRLLQRYANLSVAELTEIRRQEGELYRKAVSALSKGDLRTGFRRLDQLEAIIEVANDAERYWLLAKDFLALSRSGSVPLVVSPTHAEGAEVTKAIRHAKMDAGLLGPERLFPQFHSLQWEEPDKRHPENYRAGLVVHFHQHASGIQRGTLARVTGVNEKGEVLATSTIGQDFILPLKQASRFQVFEERQIYLAKGDRIRITQGGKSVDGRRLNNGNLFTIKSIGRDGKLTLNTGAVLSPFHGFLSHGYVQTSHAAQGKSVRNVLVAQKADSFLAGSREQFYVSVSRGKESLRIYTDDRRELERTVGYSSSRRAGVELAGFTSKEVSALMNEALNGRQWQDLVHSRREGAAKNHVQNLLKERRSDGLTKPANMDFRKYIEMRRQNAGADGKSRSKGHPSEPGQKKQNTVVRGRSFLRPTQARTAEPKVTPPQNENRKAPVKKSIPAVPPRQSKAIKAFQAAKHHFAKIANRAKTAIQSFKSGKRPKGFPEPSVQQVAKQKGKRQATGAMTKAKTQTKTPVKAPTPPPPVRRK